MRRVVPCRQSRVAAGRPDPESPVLVATSQSPDRARRHRYRSARDEWCPCSATETSSETSTRYPPVSAAGTGENQRPDRRSDENSTRPPTRQPVMRPEQTPTRTLCPVGCADPRLLLMHPTGSLYRILHQPHRPNETKT